MFNSEISNKVLLTIVNNNQSVELNQKYIRIRENKNGLMALNYIAPLFETMSLEDFFENIDYSGKLTLNIGGTGDICVNFRGIVEGKGKNFSKNIGHIIILLENHPYYKYCEYINVKKVSKFIPKDRFS